MDGFYEWQTIGKTKIPHHFAMPDGAPFAVAALWEAWWPPEDPANVLHSVTLVTTAPNPTVAALHDRMAVILPKAAWPLWLSPQPLAPELLQPLLVPFAGDLAVLRVTSYVNVAGREGPQCLQPAEGTAAAPSSRQGSLF